MIIGFDLRIFVIIGLAMAALLAASVIYKSVRVANEGDGEELPPPPE